MIEQVQCDHPINRDLAFAAVTCAEFAVLDLATRIHVAMPRPDRPPKSVPVENVLIILEVANWQVLEQDPLKWLDAAALAMLLDHLKEGR